MKLSYRGAQYDYTQPSLEVTEGEILRQHRSASFRCQTVQEMPVPQSGLPLLYRGIHYVSSAGSCASDVAQPVLKGVVIPETTRLARREIARLHRANLVQNLERRLHVAKTHGNQDLVNLLEAERRQLV